MDKKTSRKQFRVKAERFTHKQFEAQFSNDAACLADIFRKRFPNGITCPTCGLHDKFYPIAGRRAYSCVCGFQVYPTAGSIFHKSATGAIYFVKFPETVLFVTQALIGGRLMASGADTEA